MCSISSAQKENIIVLASNGQSTCKIASSLDVNQLSESSKTSFPTISHLILIILPSSLPPLNALSLHKSSQERLPMLSTPQNTSIPSFPTLSPHKLCTEFLNDIH
jgi:hypothetical protein